MEMTAVSGDGSTIQSDLRRFFEALRRWWWLLFLGPIVVGAITYAVVSRQPPVYVATATLGVDVAQSAMGSNISTVQGSKELAETYRQLLASDPVLQAVIDELQLSGTLEDLRKRVEATVVRDTQLLAVTVSDGDRARAAEIANAVANQFGAFLERVALDAITSSREALEERVEEVEGRIAETNAQLAAAGSAEAVWPPSLPGSQVSEDALAASVASLNTELDNLLGQIDQLNRDAAEAGNQISLIVPATPPVEPSEPQPVLSAMAGVLAGLVLAGGAVVLLEFLDISVRTPAQITSLARGASVPNVITARRMRRQDDLFILNQPQSAAAESIRMLGAAVDTALAQRSTKQIVSTSAGSDASSALIMANLGVALAQMGRRVALVDTDYRDPTLHKVFAAHNARGLTTMLRSPEAAWRSATVDVSIPNLILIPSGPAPSRPDQQFNANRLQRLRSQFGEIAGSVDVILISVPPILAAGSPIVAAIKADSALVVCRGGRTTRDSLERSVNSLLDMDVPVLGIVIS